MVGLSFWRVAIRVLSGLNGIAAIAGIAVVIPALSDSRNASATFASHYPVGLDELDALTRHVDNVNQLYGVFFLLHVLIAITLICWGYALTRSARQRTGDIENFRPGWAVGCWFIPFVNLYSPFLVLRDGINALYGHQKPVTLKTAWGAQLTLLVLLKISDMTESSLLQRDPGDNYDAIAAWFTSLANDYMLFLGILILSIVTSIAWFRVAMPSLDVDDNEVLVSVISNEEVATSPRTEGSSAIDLSSAMQAGFNNLTKKPEIRPKTDQVSVDRPELTKTDNFQYQSSSVTSREYAGAEATLLLFKRPVIEDWLLWIYMLLAGATAIQTIQTYSGSPLSNFTIVAGTIDVGAAFVGNWLIVVLPIGLIRKALAKKRQSA